MEGKTQQAAAASAAMSERSARKWQRGSLPSERKTVGRSWRTRPDPFAVVWEREVEVFGSERLTGALLDRLTHRVHILEMNGESYRLRQSRKSSALRSAGDLPDA